MTQKAHERTDETSAASQSHSGGFDEDGVVMRLWTRRPVCGPRTEIIDRLSALSAADSLADFEIETWPDEVSLGEYTEHSRVVETYEVFSEWAAETGVSITPPFERRTATSLVGRTEDVLRVPMLCLAVYDDGLCGVYPCSDGDRTYSVADYLDAYEAADGRPTDVDDVAVPAGDT